VIYQWILTDEFVPGSLAADEKQQRVSIFQKLCHVGSDNASFLSRVITGDELDKATILPMEKSELTKTKERRER
jgi:hypothetical protein